MPIDVASETEEKSLPGFDPCVSHVVVKPVRPTVLAYHELTVEQPNYRYALACRDFERHLQITSQLGGKAVVVSFDDGHISNYVSALPLLQKYGCKAIFFVIVGRIGADQNSMTWAHLRELIALGHSVEAHGWSHAFLTGRPDAEVRMELVRCKEELEEKLGVPVRALSAPHGRWNSRVAELCSHAGYSRLYVSTPWVHRKLSDVEVVGRLMVTRSMDSEQLVSWLTMGRAEAALQRVVGGLKHSMRSVLGDGLYHKLWTLYSGWERPQDNF